LTNFEQNGVQRESVPVTFDGARRALCVSYEVLALPKILKDAVEGKPLIWWLRLSQLARRGSVRQTHGSQLFATHHPRAMGRL
jgi:hypothetical protein